MNKKSEFTVAALLAFQASCMNAPSDEGLDLGSPAQVKCPKITGGDSKPNYQVIFPNGRLVINGPIMHFDVPGHSPIKIDIKAPDPKNKEIIDLAKEVGNSIIGSCNPFSYVIPNVFIKSSSTFKGTPIIRRLFAMTKAKSAPYEK